MNTYNKHANLFPRLSNEQKLQEIMKTGLNNIKYTVVERSNPHEIVELVKVEI
jgi:hypothetical protein